VGYVVGIDLGTTNSLVAYMRGERPEIIANAAGQRLTPSIVGLDRAGRLHVGDTARNQLLALPERTAAEFKRLMGSTAKVRLGDREYSPQELSALVLKQLKEDAERHLGAPVAEAVITVPAYFTDAQRQATKDAGELAGFVVDRIINEPTAAALAYGLDHLDAEQLILVYDLGGGTFDVSVLEMFQGVLDVKAAAGNNHLGGGDFDRLVADWLAGEFAAAHGVDLRRDPQALLRLRVAAEQAKLELSTRAATTVRLPFVAVRAGEPLSLELELTRAKLEELVGPLVRSTLEPLAAALRDAKLDRGRISDVVLVGGSSRMPLVRRLLAEYFDREPRGGVHPDEAIALGAAVQAGLKSGVLSSERGIMITDVCPFTLGVEVASGAQRQGGLFSPIIPRNSTVPVARTEVYSTTATEQRAVDIKIYQGESRLTRHNTFLDAYSIDGIPPAPAGHEKVAITFSYDLNGILNVRTKIVSTGKEAQLVVDRSGQRLSAAERATARQRLDREWAPAEVATAAGAGDARYRAAEALFGDGQWAAAIAELEAALLRLGDGDGDGDGNARRLLARAYERAGRADDALRTLQELVARAPDEATARDDLAAHYLAHGRIDDALVQTEEAARLAPADPRWRRILADLYRRQRLLPQARAALEAALTLAPHDSALAAELRALADSGRDDPAAAAVGQLGVLGYSPLGGALSPLEAVAVAGHGQLVCSGNLGALGREAAMVAYSCLKLQAPRWQLEARIATHDLHFHFADSDIGKDGPSAGLALWLAGASALLQRPLRAQLAATGELTLQGDVKAVGGIHEKLVAARLAGVRTVLMPRRNAAALAKLPPEVAVQLQIILVDSVTDALEHALL
jgi:molecular chaperone DnaK